MINKYIKTTANKGFAIVGQNSKVQRLFSVELLCKIEVLCFHFPPERQAPKRLPKFFKNRT